MKILNPSRLLALATAGVLSASVLLAPAPARADKAKNYKYGAIALGVLGGVLLSKGKTVEGAAVLGAGAYTYKKGEDARKADKYDNYRDRYGYRNGDRYSYNNGDRYGTNGSYDNDYRDRYNVPERNRLGNRDNNRNSDYRAYNSDDRYRDYNPNRYENRYDNSYGNGRNPKIRVR